MKKIVTVSLFCILLLSLCGCNAVIDDHEEDYSNQTLTGQITQIDGTEVTLALGKLKEENSPMEQMQMPDFSMMEKPEGMEGFGFPGSREEDDSMSELPEDFKGEKPDNFNDERPEKPGSDNMNKPQDMDGSAFPGPREDGGTPPELPEDFDSQMPFMDDGSMPGMMSVTYTFKEGKDTADIQLKDTEVILEDGSIGSVSDLNTGDVIQIVIGDHNTIESIQVYPISTENELYS